MKTKTSRRAMIIVVLVSVMLAPACVSKKKYEAAVNDAEQQKAQNKELASQNASLNSTVAAAEKYKQECDAVKTDCENAKKRLDVLTGKQKEAEANLEKLRAQIYTVLVDFINKGVNVEYKKGLVYVNLQESLLFSSGSTSLEKKGEEALSSLAKVLNEYPQIRIIVLGHTDSVMYKGAKDNWTLSTERANGVVRVLRDNKVDPVRLTAAGKGKYDPIASNATPEGRAKNRRIEIILRSDLDQQLKEAVILGQ